MLAGGVLADVFAATPDNDSLSGGAGSDTVSYAGADHAVTIDLRLAGPQDTTGSGLDTLKSIENLIGSDFDDVLFGTNAGALTKISGQIPGQPVYQNIQGGTDFDYRAGVFSPDGSKVAFYGGGLSDIYVKDLATGVVTLVTTFSSIDFLISGGFDPEFSRDSNKIVFRTYSDPFWRSPNTTKDHNGDIDVYVKDLRTGEFYFVSSRSDGSESADSGRGNAEFSPDGLKVMFSSGDSNLSNTWTTTGGIYIKNLYSGQITLVSTTANGVSGNDGSGGARYLDDNHFVFASYASNFLPSPPEIKFAQIYVKSLTDGNLTLITSGIDGKPGYGNSGAIDVSADGTKIVFYSEANNLVAGDTNNIGDIFLKDLITGELTRVSTDSFGGETSSGVDHAVISPDGSKIAFLDRSPQGLAQFFVKDLSSGIVSMVSNAPSGISTYDPFRFSPDGESLIFDALNSLTADDVNTYSDVYIQVISGDANRLDGGAGADTIHGGDGADTLIGGAGDDVLYGDAGDDRFYVAKGADRAYGGGGADAFQYGVSLESDPAQAVDTLVDGGAGIDTIDLGLQHEALTIDLSVKVAWQAIGFGRLSQTGIENVSSGAGGDRLTGDVLTNQLAGRGGDDTLIGGGGDDTLTGGTGDDSLDGGTGIDTVSYAGAASGVTVTLATTGPQDTGGDGIDTLKAVEALVGSAYGDLLTGGASANLLSGGLGADTLDGGLGADTLIGGAGDDFFRIDSGQDVLRESLGGGFDIAETTANYVLAAGVALEVLRAAAGTSPINLKGNDYAQTLVGNAGINTLDGYWGADTMIGGAGNDTYLVDNSGDVIIEQNGEGFDTVRTTSSTYALGANLEVLTFVGTSAFRGTGNDLANVITGGKGIDQLDGGAGADRLIGGLGNDTYLVDNLGDVVVEDVNQGFDTVRAKLGSYVLGANVENLTFTGTGKFAGFGNDLANVLTGGAGSDTLDGKAGADRMVGAAGDDLYYTDNVNDTVVELAGQGYDKVFTTLQTAKLADNVEQLLFIGAGNFTGYANAAGSMIFAGAGSDVLVGGAGADFLGGMAGADTLTGGGAADIFYFDGPNTGIDRITDFQSGIDHIELRANTFGIASLADLSLLSGVAPSAMGTGPTLLYDTTTGGLFFDLDGSQAGAAVQIALLAGKPTLALADFFVA
ncbi:calcium-binding protein [soil metagenome]